MQQQAIELNGITGVITKVRLTFDFPKPVMIVNAKGRRVGMPSVQMDGANLEVPHFWGPVLCVFADCQSIMMADRIRDGETLEEMANEGVATYTLS